MKDFLIDVLAALALAAAGRGSVPAAETPAPLPGETPAFAEAACA